MGLGSTSRGWLGSQIFFIRRYRGNPTLGRRGDFPRVVPHGQPCTTPLLTCGMAHMVRAVSLCHRGVGSSRFLQMRDHAPLRKGSTRTFRGVRETRREEVLWIVAGFSSQLATIDNVAPVSKAAL